MKTLVAEKMADGYSVEIITTLHVGSYADLLRTIKQEGLTIKSEADFHIIAK